MAQQQLSVSLPATKLKAFESYLALKSYYLPKMSSTLPMRYHSNFVALARKCDDWIFDHLGITDAYRKKDMIQWRIPLFNNLVIPCGDFEQSLAGCKFTWAVTALDDPLDEEALKRNILSHLSTVMSIVKVDESVSYSGALNAWKDTMDDMRRLMPVPVYKRFQHGVQTWANSFINLAELSPSAFMVNRRANICMLSWLPIMELCLGVCLEDEDVESQDYISAIEAMIDNIWLVNDLYSAAREYRLHTVRNMQFMLLATDPEVHSYQEAVNKVCRLIQEKEEEYIFYQDIVVAKAKESGKADFLKYMEGLRGMIHSNLVYHSVTGRYHGVDNPYVNGDILYGTLDLTSPELTFLDRKPEKTQGEHYRLLAL